MSTIQTVRFYDTEANEQKSMFDHRAAVLACCFADDKRAYSGGLDTSVREYVPQLPAIYVSHQPLSKLTDLSWTPKE